MASTDKIALLELIRKIGFEDGDVDFIGVRDTGGREVLGFDIGTSEDGSFWLTFIRSLVARGLRGVQLVISDAHEGLRSAIGSALTGATWQRCRVHTDSRH